jgi:hypothetical protein
MSGPVTLYDEHNLDTLHALSLPDEAAFVRAFFQMYLTQPSHQIIENVHAKVKLLHIDQHLVPITVCEKNNQDAYVASLSGHYINYAKEELYLVPNKALRTLLSAIIKLIKAAFLAAKTDQTVFVNNWLFSTNLYPNLNGEQIEQITEFLKRQFPDHYIVFRSVHDAHYKNIGEACIQQGYSSVPSRQIYIFKQESDFNARDRQHLNRDEKIIPQMGYTVVETFEPSPDILAQIQALYDDLYLRKYSHLNPVFTAAFYSNTASKGLLKYILLYDKDKMIGVIGYWHMNGVMTTPILGYEVDRGRETKAYRVLSHLIVREAKKHSLRLNQSSGAAEFKSLRGNVAQIESSYVFDRHIPLLRRLPFTIFRWLLRKFGVPLMQNYQL